MVLENWSLRKYPSNKPSVILQASDTAWTYDNLIALDHDLDIYAESVTLPAHLSAQGRHIGIYSNRLDVLSDSEIQVSGAPGTSENVNLFANVKSGGKGGNAGEIELYVEEASLDTFQRLRLRAAGGKGGSGEDTASGDVGGLGGDGGNAGPVTSAVRTWGFTATLMDRANAILRAKNESEALKRQMLQDFITYCSRLEHPQSDKPDHSSKVAELKSALTTNSSVDDLIDRFREQIGNIFSNESSAFDTLIGSKVESAGGAYGTGGQGKKRSNQNGKPGTSVIPKVSYCYLRSDKLRQLGMPIAHPDQCAMVVNLAKLDYYIDSEASKKSATERLMRLHDRLLFIDGLQASDSIYKAYQTAEVRLHVLPRPQAASATVELASISRLREVAAEVDDLLRQIAGGLDFYGHKAEWVPRGSREFYDNLTMAMLSNAQLIEKAHETYRNADKDTAKKTTAVREVRNQAHVGAEAARDYIEQLRPLLEATVIAIGSMDFHMKECKNELLQKMQDQIAAIKRVEEKLGADFGDIVEAATMVAFCPNPAMVLIQGAGLTYKAVKDAKIENDDGEPGIKKDLLVKKMSSLEKGTNALVQGYKASKADDHAATIDDPSATKLLTKKEDFMELMSNYTKALGDEKLEDIAKSFDTFIGTLMVSTFYPSFAYIWEVLSLFLKPIRKETSKR